MKFFQQAHEQVPLSLNPLLLQTADMVAIRGYDHVGIRVTSHERALSFYGKLGFIPDPDFSNERVAEIVAPDGTRINLIFNASPRRNNILLDEPIKWPGYTHGAFIVESLQELLDWARREGIEITEGPVDWGRRTTCFIRDPDGNVLEFNEIKVDPGSIRGNDQPSLARNERSRPKHDLL